MRASFQYLQHRCAVEARGQAPCQKRADLGQQGDFGMLQSVDRHQASAGDPLHLAPAALERGRPCCPVAVQVAVAHSNEQVLNAPEPSSIA